MPQSGVPEKGPEGPGPGAGFQLPDPGRSLGRPGAGDAGGSAGDGGEPVLSPWLALLGLARRAGALQLGEEAARQAALDHKARLLILAADAGENTAQRLKRLESDKLPVITLPETKAEMGEAVGFETLAAVAVCDLGFAAALAEKLAQQHPQWASAAQTLNTRQGKALRRKADTARHGKKSARRRS